MDSSQIKVSIIMPSLNVRPFIQECMESVISQSLKEIEIICVDAGSTDGTLEFLQQYANSDSRIRIILSEKKSYGHQVNLGIDAARGTYLGIVETDDYVSPEMFRILFAAAERYELDFVKADFCRFSGDGSNRKLEYADIAPDEYYYRTIDPSASLPILKDGHCVVPWAGIYRLQFLRDNHIALNPSPGASYQDNGFWFQVATKAHRCRFLNSPMYYLRRDNPNSSMLSKGKVYCMCDEYDFIREHLHQSPDLEAKYAGVCAYRRFENYVFTLNRIAEEYRPDFLKRFAEDFNKIKANGELQRELYSPEKWELLDEITADPEAFYRRNAPLDIFGWLSAHETPFSSSSPSKKIGKVLKHLSEDGIPNTVHHYYSRMLKRTCRKVRRI